MQTLLVGRSCTSRSSRPLKSSRVSAMALMLLDTYGLVYRAFFALPGSDDEQRRADQRRLRLHDDAQQAHRRREADARDRRLRQGHARRARRALRRIQGAAPSHARRAAQPVRARAPSSRQPFAFRSSRSKVKRPTTSSRRSRVKPKRPASRRSSLPAISICCRSSTSARRVLTTRRGITELGRYDPAAVRERFGLEPAQLPDYRGLKGDPSDNLPGIPGVGEKTASKLLQAAGSLDALVADPALAGNPKLRTLDRGVRRAGLSLPRRLDRAARSAARDRLGGEPLLAAPGERRALPRSTASSSSKRCSRSLQPPADLPLFEKRARR